MITNLDDAQNSLSHLVELASQGEEIVITVGGRPTARLTCIDPRVPESVERKEWAEELFAAAQAARVGDCQSTPQNFWDDLREERI